MAQLLRIMANLMRPDAPGAAEVGYKGMAKIADGSTGGSAPHLGLSAHSQRSSSRG